MDKRLEENNVKFENDRKKSYLRGYRMHGRRIKRIELEIDEIRNLKMYPSVNNDGCRMGADKATCPVMRRSSHEKEEMLYQEGVEQVKAYKDISWRIQQLENEDERDVLFYRYIKGMSWWRLHPRWILARAGYTSFMDEHWKN